MTRPSPASMPLVTVGIPVYNAERHLVRCFDSILAQTLENLLLVISDNASTDGTGEICRHYAGRDLRVRYHRNERNIGMYANFNRVFRLADSKYFKWASADDYWAPTMLGNAVGVLERDPSIVLCYPRTVLVDDTGIEQGRHHDVFDLMDEDAGVRHATLIGQLGMVNHLMGVIRSDAIARTRLLMQHSNADKSLLADLVLYGKFYQLPEYQYFRRFHPGSWSWNSADELHSKRRFNPSDSRGVAFETWRYHFGLMRGVMDSDLRFGQKARILGDITRRARWDRKALLHESLDVLRALLKPRRGPTNVL